MNRDENITLLSSDIWGKDEENKQILPPDATPLCAYEMLILGLADADEIAYLHITDTRDELWVLGGDEFLAAQRDALRSGHLKLEALSVGLEQPAQRALVIAHTDSAIRSGRYLLEEYFNAIVGFSSPVRFIAPGMLLRTDYETMLAKRAARIKQNREAARRQETEIINVARELGLQPQPPLLNPGIWSASCPRTNHQLYLNSKDNTFGCGYCGQKGGSAKLREFVAMRRQR